MISTIIEGLDLAAAQQLPTGARSGLAELRHVEGGTAPYVYSGSGDWTQIANDNAGTFSYWRLTSPVVEVDTDGPSCNDYFQATYQLRLVSMVDRSLCGNVIDAARSASSAIRGADQGVAQALGLSIPRTSVTKVSVETDSRRVYQNEFGTAGDVPPSLTLIAIDVTFVAVGSAACFAPCEVPGSLLCLSIAQATWAKVKACMSEAQLAAAEADLCNGGGPCEIDITVNDTAFDTATGATFNLPVVDETSTAVGSKVGPNWVVPTAKSLCQLVTEGTSAEVATCVTASGKRPGVLAELIPTVDEADTVAQVFDVMTPAQQDLFDVTVQLRDSAGNNIGLPDVYAAGTNTTKTAPDASWTLKDEAGNVLDSGAIASGGAADIVAPDAKVQLKDSADNNIGSDNSYLSGSTNNLTAPDGTVTILNPNGDSLGTQAVRSNGTANFTAPIPLKFVWAPGDADTYLWIITADEAGSYTTFTDNGAVGSLTYSINGGAFNAVTGTVTLVVGQTIVVRRSTTTLEGVARWVL